MMQALFIVLIETHCGAKLVDGIGNARNVTRVDALRKRLYFCTQQWDAARADCCAAAFEIVTGTFQVIKVAPSQRIAHSCDRLQCLCCKIGKHPAGKAVVPFVVKLAKLIHNVLLQNRISRNGTRNVEHLAMTQRKKHFFVSVAHMNPLAFATKRDKPQKSAELTVSQFKVNRATASSTALKKKKSSNGPERPTDPRSYHKVRLAEFARDLRETLPKKRKELELGNLNARRKKILEAEVRSLEARDDERQYVERVTPLLKRYEECLKASVMMQPTDHFGVQQHFGRVENTELKAAKDAFYMETMGFVPTADGGSSGTPGAPPAGELPSCDVCKKPLVLADGYDVCIECGSVPVNSCSDYQVSYRDTQEMMVKVNGSYKRSTRFSDWLSAIQAKENTEIPANVYSAIMKEIARERIENLSSLDTQRIKDYLRKMGLTRYYDHAPRILKCINGQPPVNIPPEIEAMLNIMFNHIQEPFEIVKNSAAAAGRSSFMHYNFVLFKFCELLGCTDIVKPQLLKCPEKLRFQETMWEAVCELVSWPFIPTI